VDNMSYLIWDTVSEANEITHHEYNNFWKSIPDFPRMVYKKREAPLPDSLFSF
jgi:hypothetical protein